MISGFDKAVAAHWKEPWEEAFANRCYWLGHERVV
jgi:hypothetical protein